MSAFDPKRTSTVSVDTLSLSTVNSGRSAQQIKDRPQSRLGPPVTARMPFLRNLWKTRTTRNFAGFSAFRHIPGIGRWCILRVLKPMQSASDTSAVCPSYSTAESALIGPDRRWSGLLFFSGIMANDSTRYLHSCRRHHDRPITSLWLAGLHDAKRGTS